MKKRSKIGIRIKRSFILILILAAIGSVGYFGYLQFQLPLDNYGLIFTKYTGDGWKHDVIKPASFRFEWEGLIPTNLSIDRFILLPQTSRVSISGALPSAEIYSIYLEGSPDFKYSYTFDMLFTVKPDCLVSLATDEFLREDNFDSWIENIEKKLSTDAAEFITQMATNYDYMDKISYNHRLMENDLKKELEKSYPYLQIVSFIPVEINFPDLTLYAEGRRQYFEIEKYQSDIQQASLDKTENLLVEESAKLELLQKYGALFAEYPQLIEYYALFSNEGSGVIPLVQLPELGTAAE